jgi:hypothetical protein
MADLYTKNNNIAKAKTFANKAKAINKEWKKNLHIY